MMKNIIFALLVSATLSGCDANFGEPDHEKSFAWAKEFCGEAGIFFFDAHMSFTDSVQCGDGRRVDIPVK